MENNYIKTLILLNHRLEGIDFAFVGSISLYLQGIKSIKPRDIDLVVYEKDLDKKIQIGFESVKLSCISLEDDLKVYKALDREDKVKIIKDFLK
ncbi:hypothetical protein KKH36_02190 [Patescibacteria group bacterium]|nr:hypothetical protein [Patescibacteria group bacterium]